MFHLRTWLLISFLIFTYSCSQSPISGKITNTDADWEPMVYLIEAPGFDELYSSYEGTVIDSARLSSNGNFSFTQAPSGNEEKILLLALQKKGETYSNKLNTAQAANSNFIPFIWSPGAEISIESDVNSLMGKVKISESSTINKDTRQLFLNQIELQTKLLNELGKYNEEDLLENEKAVYEYQKALWESLGPESSLLVTALALRMIAPNRDYERIPEILADACSRMKAINPNHPYTLSVCEQAELLPLKQGDTFPDFALPLVDGKEKPLYALMGHRLTIIDLWASWCAPCRIENRNTLVPLWEKYYKDGFEIIAYALDADYDGWTAAIEKDGTDRWPHASHLDGDDSPFLERLRVSVIPANYIIDGEGKILAKNLHGEELEEFVNAYFRE